MTGGPDGANGPGEEPDPEIIYIPPALSGDDTEHRGGFGDAGAAEELEPEAQHYERDEPAPDVRDDDPRG